MLTATKSTKIELSSENKTKEFADTFSTKIKIGDIIYLYGEIGVGKTTFIKYLINIIQKKCIYENMSFSNDCDYKNTYKKVGFITPSKT